MRRAEFTRTILHASIGQKFSAGHIINLLYLFWLFCCLHTGNHTPQVPQVPDARPVPPYEGGPRDVGTVSGQKETLCWKFGCFTERLLANHLLLFLFEFSGCHVDACFVVEGEARGRMENISRLHLRERE